MSCRCALKTVPILACAMIALDLASAYGQPVSFMAPRVFPTGGSSIVVGDFNGDGKPDLATPGLMLLGNGDGSLHFPFQLAIPQSALSQATSIGTVSLI